MNTMKSLNAALEKRSLTIKYNPWRPTVGQILRKIVRPPRIPDTHLYPPSQNPELTAAKKTPKPRR